MNLYRIAACLLLCLPRTLSAQDSTRVLDFETYLGIVRTQHPAAMQAAIQTEKGAAAVQKARGFFDPKVFTGAAQKYYDSKQYYSVIEGGLKIPTWYGLEFKTGYEQNGGVFLNPEEKTPTGGLAYAGVSLALGQGLLMDERRAGLRMAQAFAQGTEAERLSLLNDLLYDAGKAYWEWFAAWNTQQVYVEAVRIAQQRLDGVKQTALLGDRPSMDTLEASIQVQTRRLSLQQADLELANAAAMLSVYLWAEGQVPLELAPGTVPQPLETVRPLPADPSILTNLDSLVTQHPDLRVYAFKREQLVIERRWKQEQLKPTLNLNYNALLAPVNGLPAYSVNNYKWGFEFNMPILLRKARGEVAMAGLKIQETDLTIDTKTAQLTAKANQALNEWQNTRDQSELYAQTVTQYGQLLEGERKLFEAGESSLFLVNARESAWQAAQVKRLEILAKNRKAQLTSSWSLGLLAE